MAKVKSFMKMITIIVLIVALGYTFSKMIDITKPTGSMGITVMLYFIVIALSIIIKFMPDRIINLEKIRAKVDYNEFRGIYQEVLKVNKEELEKYRKPLVIKRIIRGIFLVVATISFIMIQSEFIEYLTKEQTWIIFYALIISVVIVAITFFVYSKVEIMYRKTFKEKVIGVLIKQVGNKLSYSNDLLRKPIILNLYAKAEFDVTTYNSSKVDDHVFGYLEEGLPIAMANIKLERIISTGKSSTVVKIFEGMFVEISAQKNVGATIKILSNRNKKHSKIDLLSNKCFKLEMESKTFEKYFNVYTDNKIVAMQILTSEIQEMLTGFRENFGVDVEIAIDNNRVYLRFHTGPMFEARLFSSSIREKDLILYYGVLKMIITLSHKLNDMIINAEV